MPYSVPKKPRYTGPAVKQTDDTIAFANTDGGVIYIGIEFISIGGLLPGLSADDMRSGISQPRNHKLAEIFHLLRLIESYGTGIRKIYALYKDCAVQPRIEVTTNTVMK